MTSAQMQRRLDTAGRLTMPALDTTIDVPLFLESGNVVQGDYEEGSRISSSMGTSFIAGWKRGLLDNSFFPPGGFRTKGVAHLHGRGAEFDQGPVGSQYWAGTNFIRINFRGTCHGASWITGTNGEVTNCPLVGVWRNEATTYAPHPSPYCLYWSAAGYLVVGVRLADGSERFSIIDADPNTPLLDVTVDVDLRTGSNGVRATVNGVSVEGTGSMPVTTLHPNSEYAWCLGWASASANGGGGWHSETLVGPRVDFTCTKFEIYIVPFDCWSRVLFTRPATYEGGPSLPLVRTQSQYGTQYVLAVRWDQGEGSLAGGVKIRDLNINVPYQTMPAIVLGSIQGGVTVKECQIDGGSRGIQSSGLAVTYPVRVLESVFRYQRDAALWIRDSGAGFAVDLCDFGNQANRVARLQHCYGTVDRCVIAPPATPQQSIFEQVGGDVEYRAAAADYEYENPTPFLRLTPAGVAHAEEPTKVVLNRVAKDEVLGPMLIEMPPAANYEGEVEVRTIPEPTLETPQNPEE